MRDVLPQRRPGVNLNFRHGNFEYTATFSYYPDMRIGEIFLSAAKSGTQLDVATRDAAILASFALQHGCPLETLRTAMTRDATGRAEGAMGTLFDLLQALEGKEA